MFNRTPNTLAPSVVERTNNALVLLISKMIVPPMAIVLFAACDTPTSVSPEGDLASYSSVTAGMTADEDQEIFIIEADGTSRAIRADEEGIVVSAPGAGRVDLQVVGMATYDNPTAKQFRLSVRQTADGTVTGNGRVTLGEHTTDVIPLCITPYYSFGRMQYGVGVKLAEPWIVATQYGTFVRTHVSLSVTADGEYTGMLGSQFGPVCGASSLRDPVQVVSGSMQVIEAGRVVR